MLEYKQPDRRSGHLNGAFELDVDDIQRLVELEAAHIAESDGEYRRETKISLKRTDGSLVIARSVEEACQLPLDEIKDRNSFSVETRLPLRGDVGVTFNYESHSLRVFYSMSCPNAGDCERKLVSFLRRRRPWFSVLYSDAVIGIIFALNLFGIILVLASRTLLPSPAIIYSEIFGSILVILNPVSWVFRRFLFPQIAIFLGPEAKRLNRLASARRLIAAGLGAVFLALISGGYLLARR